MPLNNALHSLYIFNEQKNVVSSRCVVVGTTTNCCPSSHARHDVEPDHSRSRLCARELLDMHVTYEALSNNITKSTPESQLETFRVLSKAVAKGVLLLIHHVSDNCVFLNARSMQVRVTVHNSAEGRVPWSKSLPTSSPALPPHSHEDSPLLCK
jgi:hypothetical protein